MNFACFSRTFPGSFSDIFQLLATPSPICTQKLYVTIKNSLVYLEEACFVAVGFSDLPSLRKTTVLLSDTVCIYSASS